VAALDKLKEIPGRISELREIMEISEMDMAKAIGVDDATYQGYENGTIDIPISSICKIADKLGVDPTVLLTGEDPKMTTAAVCRAGKGVDVERYPGYEFSSLAYNFKGRVIEPLLVTLDSTKPTAPLVSHNGQEFNYVLSGHVQVTVGNAKYLLGGGDSIYFDATLQHGQKGVDGIAKFITIIQE
jgi:transcriptional regulator with XRE-family HTH domain